MKNALLQQTVEAEKRRRLYTAATWRLEGIVEDFPDYSEMDKVLHMLGMSYFKGKNAEKAAEFFEQLRTEYPESRYLQKIPNKNPKEKNQT